MYLSELVNVGKSNNTRTLVILHVEYPRNLQSSVIGLAKGSPLATINFPDSKQYPTASTSQE